MREKCRFGGIKKTVAILAASLALFRADPLVDRAKADEQSIVTKKYKCEVKEKRTTAAQAPMWSPKALADALRYKKSKLELTVIQGPDSQTISLQSPDKAFNNQTLTFKSQELGFGYYDNHVNVFGYRFDGIGIGFETAKRIRLDYSKWLDANTHIAKFATCQLVSVTTQISKLLSPKPADAPSKPASDNLRRGVFIRPCPGQFFDEDAFEHPDGGEIAGPINLAELKTNVGGGTLKSSCEDLRDSGVTDIFLPFKVDDWNHAPQCGHYGQLLYPSSLSNRVSEMVTNAQAVKIDPIGSIMSVCKDVYGDKTLHFHAWFPVFKDPYAAEIQGVKGKLKFSSSNVIDMVGLPTDVEYTSHLFADPGNVNVRLQQLAILREIIQLYPKLYGINLDYIRYPEQETIDDVSKPGEAPECIRDPRVSDIKDTDCKDVDEKYIAKRVVWYVDLVSGSVEQFVKSVKTAFPGKELSADVFIPVTGRLGLGQDGALGHLNVIMPMTYQKSGNVTGAVIELRLLNANKPIVPDLRGWTNEQTGEELISDLARDIQSAKNAGAAGFSIFTYESFLGDTDSDSLKSVKNKLGF